MQEERAMTKEMRECMVACFSCAQICNKCGDDMIGMDGENHDSQLMSLCIRLCRDCAEICLLTAQWIGRTSLFATQLCRLCSEICERCAEICEQHAPHHALCGPCAQQCRRCADLCRRMTAASKAA